MGEPASRTPPALPGTPKSEAGRKRPTVLLVDDRSYDQAAIAHALAARRITAPTLPNAVRAIALLELAVERIDALLVSTAMPGCLSFVKNAASMRPDLRFGVLGLSGKRTSRVLEHLDRIGRPCRVLSPDAGAEDVAREVAALVGAHEHSDLEAA